MHNFYPDGHPNLDQALERCFSIIKKNVDENGDLKWRLDQKGFYDDKTPIAPGNLDVASLARKIFFRRINQITFTHRFNSRELSVFLSMLKLEPDDVHARGGAETLMAGADVSGILLNALTYDDLEKLKADLEEKKKQEAAEKELPEAAGEAGEADELKKQPDEKEQASADDLATLIAKIRVERDSLRYNDLSARIKEKADELLHAGDLDNVLGVMIVFLEGMKPSSGLPEEITAAADERLRSLFNPDMMRLLVGKLGAKEEPLRDAIKRILLIADTQAFEPLLDALVSSEDAASRRHYFDGVVMFGPKMRPNVEHRLQSDKWFIVRQMAAILGELGDEGCLDELENAYGHEDTRVKKEVLKSLVKIRSKRSTAILINALEEKEESLVNQAIISLGMLKDSSAIDILGKIAGKRDPFAETREATKEAIKALGNIGNEKALPYLVPILLRKVWFGKESNEQARALAANALGAIGSKKAIDAVRDCAAASSGDLHAACRRILDAKARIK
ncbi:MAG: HEAT repeat domain-containing protein [Deltaproteobacteria bacterium]|nr:HEAT repeat domain-containing protein [Deltaproteobacteria bacterium]